MRKYNLLQPLFLSFYSKSLYQDVGKRWSSTTFLYLLLLLALVWIPAMFKLQQEFSRWIQQEAPALVSQIPTITITNGEVSTDVETPYFIREPEKDTVLAIIDLTGEYTSLDDSEARMLLTKDTFFMKKDERETRTYDLSGIEKFAVDENRVAGWLELLATWLPVLLYPFAVLFSFLFRLVQALLYAAIGLLFAKALKAPLGYAALLRLAIVAITPVILLSTAAELAGVTIPSRWLLAFVVAMIYLFFAVKATTEPESEF